MDHHGLYTDISNSFPGSRVLPNTNVKYHQHHLPQIPPQPPPLQSNNINGQGANPQVYHSQSQQQTAASYGHQQQKVQSQHVESDPIGSDLYQDAAGLFDTTNALCTTNSSSSSGSNSHSGSNNNYSNHSSNSNVNNSKSIEFTSRKFETNTGDSITYNINNINTNIVNNISGGGLGANSVQGLNPGQAAITGGPSTDFLGNPQFSSSGGNAQISFNKESDTNPTIINISNNNHNIMAPPYPYPYQTKISGMGALNELNTKFVPNPAWAASGTSHNVGDFSHENTIISNFEAKNPNKYHTNRANYRYQQDFVQSNQQPQTATHYPQHNYGLYHPEGAQATSIQQPNGHYGYEPYPHIVRGKYPSMEEASRYGRNHQHISANHSQTHPELMYNERSRYPNNFTSGYVPPAPGHYPTAQPSKNILNPNVEYFNSGYIKQIQAMNHHAANPYVSNRPTYPHQASALPNYHHQNYHLGAFEDPYHHRTRVPNISHHINEPHLQQHYPNYTNHVPNLPVYPPNHKLTFSKTTNDFYAPNIQQNPYSNPLSHPTAPSVHHAPQYNIKYTSQTIVPPHNQPKIHGYSIPPTASQQPTQKATNSCYYDTPNPVIDMNHPLVDLEEQINSVKILKTRQDATATLPANYNNQQALSYDCQQKYLMNHGYMTPKATPNSINYIANGLANSHPTNPTNYGYTTMEDLGLGSRSFTLDENLKDKNLRDYLSSWNETEEEESSNAAAAAAAVAAAAASAASVAGALETKETNNNQPTYQNFESCKYLQEELNEQLPPLHSGVIVANVQNGGTPLPDILSDLDKTKEELKTGQETTEVGEKLYILETYDVPHSELNKYKHLNVINELPKNVVPIHDSADSLKFLEEIESNREKYYQTELESEVVYDDRKKEEEKKETKAAKAAAEVKERPEKASSPVLESKPRDEEPLKEEKRITEPTAKTKDDADAFKVPSCVPKYRKRRHYHYDYPRFPKKARRSSIEDFLYLDVPKPVTKKNPKRLLTLCVATLNSRAFRRYAKEDIARRKEAELSVIVHQRVEADSDKSIDDVDETTVVGTECLDSVAVLEAKDGSDAQEKPTVEVIDEESDKSDGVVELAESEHSDQHTMELSEELSTPVDMPQGVESSRRNEEELTEGSEQPIETTVDVSPQEMDATISENDVCDNVENYILERVETNSIEHAEEKNQLHEVVAQEESIELPNCKEIEGQQESIDHPKCKEELADEKLTEAKEDDVIPATVDLTESDMDDDVFEDNPTASPLPSQPHSPSSAYSTSSCSSSSSDDETDSSSDEETETESEPELTVINHNSPEKVITPEPTAVIVAAEAHQVPVIRKIERIACTEVENKQMESRTFSVPCLRDIAEAAFNRYKHTYVYRPVPTLRRMCYDFLLSNDLLPQPESLQTICEKFICNNRHIFIIEEVRHQPERLQDICQRVVDETNIIIDVNNICIFDGAELLHQQDRQQEEEKGRVFIVEDGRGSIADLLTDNEDMDAEVTLMPEDIGEEHDIFLDRTVTTDHGCQVIMESHSLSDSENEIYKKVEQEIEKMMTTSSDEEDDSAKECQTALDAESLRNEFFSFVEDDCIQYEEVIPVDKEAFRRDSLIRDLRVKYIGIRSISRALRLKLLRKYIHYGRFFKTKDNKVLPRSWFFRRLSACLQKKIDTMLRQAVIIEDSDSNSSSTSSIVSSVVSRSSRSSSSSSSSSSSNATSTETISSSENEATTAEAVIIEKSRESFSDDHSNQSGNSAPKKLIENNNNHQKENRILKPFTVESQHLHNEEDSNSNSSGSRSRTSIRRSPNVPPLLKKKKPSFEESLLSIEQIYKKNCSPTPSTASSNSTHSSTASRKRRYSTNCRPNVIVNVNNNREAPRKLIIPSYKIFDQTLTKNLPNEEVTRLSRSISRTQSRSNSSSSSGSSTNSNPQASYTQRNSGLIRVNYPNKPANSIKIAAGNGASSRSRVPAALACLDQRFPYVRLERIDYVEKLAEQYRKQQRQQQQQQFSKQRQRRKSTFT
ncbi:uncharacterized protein LOC128744183 [Sabethes cyaneus]|uniref:uncharacterized protein LOC128744183 n=1 Tax=Sabethes cyaneus TaxID=53552 RepID=UPI00237E1CF2|nr:uncharacterized protein LOC128744183 [Sabethes cyaneus]XP_053696982.1 uncharacterized protein LOC128744183 [Sabethes cyaneus]XP_053696983.1 uncharacterized protein LOC128744183 [Sabethes cyaneus]XP_053696984.1 uncharacterized protein LOC128744183 [Sabethes cyaneus]